MLRPVMLLSSLIGATLGGNAAFGMSMTYRVLPGSTIALVGQAPAPLSGTLVLAASALDVSIPCVSCEPAQPHFPVSSLDLEGAGLHLSGSGMLPPITAELSNGRTVGFAAIRRLDPFGTPHFLYTLEMEELGRTPNSLQVRTLELRRGFDPEDEIQVQFGDGMFPESFALDLILQQKTQTHDGFTFPNNRGEEIARLSLNAIAIPEPTSLVLLGLGIVGLAALHRRQTG